MDERPDRIRAVVRKEGVRRVGAERQELAVGEFITRMTPKLRARAPTSNA
jgi:hypothetical protein